MKISESEASVGLTPTMGNKIVGGDSEISSAALLHRIIFRLHLPDWLLLPSRISE
jgi:hypothetical protein